MTPGYAEVTFTIDFEIFSIPQVSQVVHVNFTSVHSVATSNTMIGHPGGGGGGGTSTSFVRECVATGLENSPIRRLKLAQKQTHSQTIYNRN